MAEAQPMCSEIRFAIKSCAPPQLLPEAYAG